MRLSSFLVLMNLVFACLPTLASAAPNDDLGKLFSNQISSKYFKFYADIPTDKLQRYADFSDQFVDLIDRDFFKVKNKFPINAYVLTDKESYQKFLTDHLSVKKPPLFGIYLTEANAFSTYDGVGLGTFAHEIARGLLEESVKNRPEWAKDGIPAFFEKFFGYYKDGKLYINWGYQNTWRIDDLGDRLTKIKLIRVIYGSENQSEKRLLAMFLHQHGKLRAYLDLVQAGTKKDYRTYVEAVFDKPMHQIDPLWEAYLKEVANDKKKNIQVPASSVFNSEAEMNAFLKENGLAVEAVKP